MAAFRHPTAIAALFLSLAGPAAAQIAQLRPSLPGDGAPRIAASPKLPTPALPPPNVAEPVGEDDAAAEGTRRQDVATFETQGDDVGPPLEPVVDEAGADVAPRDVVSPATGLVDALRPAALLEDAAPETDPAGDRRPARFARFEPYDALGLRLGSFLLMPELQVGAAWSTNAAKSPHPASDAYLVARPRLRLLSDWRAHAVDITLSGLGSYYDRFATDDDRAWKLDARGRVDISRRSNFETSYSHDVTQESRSSLDAALLGQPRADITTDRTTAAFNTRFNRLSLQLRGTAEWSSYADTGNTSPVAHLRDRTMTDEAARATWELRPTLLGFVEASTNRRDHAGIDATDGITRSSNGERYRAGLGFGTSGPRLRGEVSIGWGRQAPDDARLGTAAGMLIDANLAWRIDGLNSLLLTASTDFADTVLPGILASTTRTVKLEGRHAFTRALIGSASIGISDASYDGSTLNERQITGGTVLEYYMSRELMTYLSWQHEHFVSTDASRKYSADEIGVGVRLVR